MTDKRLILAFAIILIGIMLWPLKSGELWLIDDHEIVYAAQQFNELKPVSFFSRYTTILLQTEVGSPNTALRYRPVYYAVRTLKSSMVGDNAKVWFLLNATCCLIGVLALGLALAKFFPWYITLPFISMTMALPLHRDLWSRLGPAEIDAFTYCMIFCLSAAYISQNTIWAWPCCNISVASAIGCKENFLLLLLPLGMLTIYGLMQKKLHPRRLWWLTFPAIVSYPVAHVVTRTMERTHNIYMQDTSTQGLMDKFVLFFTSSAFLIFLVNFVLLLLLYVITHKQKRSAFFKKYLPIPLKLWDIYGSIVVICVLAALVIGNFLYYSGPPAASIRYGFPYYFLLPAFTLCLLHPLIINIINGYVANRIFKSIITIIGVGAIVTSIPSINKNNSYLQEQIQNTVNFRNALKEAKEYREVFLINPGQMLLSYEQYFSLKRYEAAKYLPQVGYFPLWAEPESDLDETLQRKLRSALSGQMSLKLTSDVLLWQSYGGSVRKIEHTRDSRNIEELVTAFYVPYTNDGLALIASSIVFYIPANDPAVTSMKFVGSDKNNLTAWRISVNDHVITINNISYGENSFTINLPQMEPGDFIHPQLYKLSLEPNREDDVQALYLRSIELER